LLPHSEMNEAYLNKLYTRSHENCFYEKFRNRDKSDVCTPIPIKES
jgi:hypothetical protein